MCMHECVGACMCVFMCTTFVFLSQISYADIATHVVIDNGHSTVHVAMAVCTVCPAHTGKPRNTGIFYSRDMQRRSRYSLFFVTCIVSICSCTLVLMGADSAMIVLIVLMILLIVVMIVWCCLPTHGRNVAV